MHGGNRICIPQMSSLACNRQQLGLNILHPFSETTVLLLFFLLLLMS